ncbi:MAG: peptidoglycan DD-metalloendopeptidase family protein [Sphingomonadaceae bacterium]|nr:peptidoglycan DD-metalloendopeptidase family protein [Sphingomonadaceae bacterium]
MNPALRFALPVLAAAALPALVLLTPAGAQQDAGFEDVGETRDAMQRARAQAKAAEQRGERLEAEARAATEAAEKTAREAAALAARIQQAEADIAVNEARITLVNQQRDKLARRLAERRGPLLRLTASLQKMSRRPLALSALRPGSVRDAVYLRAMLETTLPQVRQRTAALRAEIERGKALEREARAALADLRATESQLDDRRKQLAAVETRQRLESRRASGAADREAERALALAEEARDLDGLVARLGEAGSLRKELASLPGPIIRPPRPEASEVVAESTAAPAAMAVRPPDGFQLPVAGRTIVGFGAPVEGGVTSKGLSLAPRNGAQIVAPAAGRVAFAGPYRGFGRIVIIEHPGGWTSLITGLARNDVAVGEELLGGAPLGVAGVDRPVVTLELRRQGEPVNPLDFL